MSTAPNAPAPAITALLPYFGAKRTLAPRIVAELGPHAAYWEPFCGSMAVLLAKPPATMETVNDLYGDVVNLARVVQHAALGPMLYRRMRRAIMAEDEMNAAAARWKARGRGPAPAPGGDPDLERACDFFVSSWVGRSGVTGTQSYNQGFALRYTKNGGHGATRLQQAVSSIPAWRRRLRNVTILNRDAFDLLDRIEDADGVVIYLDPPYVEKGAEYVHDLDAEDHRRLRDAAARFRRTRVVISYYEHPLLRELYDGWTFVDCAVAKAMLNPQRRDQREGGVRAPEVLIINGPSLTAGGLFQ